MPCVHREEKVSRVSLTLRFASVEDVAAFIKKSGISKVALSTEHVLTLLNTLRFDGEIEVGQTG